MTDFQVEWAQMVTRTLFDLRRAIDELRDDLADLDDSCAKRRQLEELWSRVDAITLVDMRSRGA